MHIGVIPARSGSKRFPNKNRAMLNGIELWQIATDKSIATMDWTIINTDYDLENTERTEIYKRPKQLCEDNVRIDDVLLEMVDNVALSDYDCIHLFQPTSPFTRLATVEKGKQALNMTDVDSVQSVLPISNTLHAYSQRTINDGLIRFAYEKEREMHFNSQRKPKHYSFAGYVAFRVGALRKYRNIWGEKSFAIMADEIESVDIDTREDLENAIQLTRTDVRRETSISTTIRRLGATV